MPVVRMPDGAMVNLPDDPTPKELAQLRLLAGPIPSNPVPEGTTARFLAGLDTAAGDIQTAVKQRIGKVSDAEVEVRRAENQGLRKTDAGQAGYFTGKTVAPALVAAAVPNPAGLVGAIGMQAGLGAAQGALEPTGVGESAATNMVGGAMGGAIGGAVGHGLARLVTPNPNPNYVPAYNLAKDALGKFTLGGSVPTTPAELGPTLLDRIQSMPHRYGGRYLGEALNLGLTPAAAAGLTGGGVLLNSGDPVKAAKSGALAGGSALLLRGTLGSQGLNRYLQQGMFGPRVDLAPYLDPLLGQAAAQNLIRYQNQDQGQQP